MLRHSLSQVPNGGDEPGESDGLQLRGFPDSSEIALELSDWEHVQTTEPFDHLRWQVMLWMMMMRLQHVHLCIPCLAVSGVELVQDPQVLAMMQLGRGCVI